MKERERGKVAERGGSAVVVHSDLAARVRSRGFVDALEAEC